MKTPLFFLVASVIAFSAGLVCFTFSVYHRTPFIPVVITICTSISSFALLTVGLWFAGERYAFAKAHGKKVYWGLSTSTTSHYSPHLKYPVVSAATG